MPPLFVALMLLLGAPSSGREGGAEGRDQMWEVLGRFETYPNSQPFPVADAVETRGIRFHTAGFRTTDSPKKVIAFYRGEFQREGLQVFEQPDPDGEILGIATYNQKTKLQRTVMAQAGHGGPTEVRLSFTDGADVLKAAESKPGDQTDGLPVHPSGVPVRSDAIRGEQTTTTVSYHAIVAPEAVITWLIPRLEAQGWVTEPTKGEPGGELRHFHRGPETLLVTAAPEGRGAAVTYTHTQ